MSHSRVDAIWSRAAARRAGGGTVTSPLRRRELAAATVGSVVEAFDWNMYVVLAPFFAAQLFPGGQGGSLVAAYAGFAVGFVARPLGGAVLGRLGDRFGRRFGLTLSMTVIAAASLVLAAVPEREHVGVWAAVVVVVARLIQGLALGGETPIVAAYITETAPPRHQFLFSSISYAGVIIGSLLSFGVISVLNATLGGAALAGGAWRWGFVLAAIVGTAAVWVRRCAPESDAFEAETAARGSRCPQIRTVFTRHPLACVALFLVTIGGTVSFYFSLVYLPVYADHIGAAGEADASAFMTLVFLVTLLAMLVAGAVIDRVGLLPMVRGAFCALVVGVPVLAAGLQAGVIGFHLVALALGLLVAIPVASANVLTGQLFPTAVRSVGVGIVGAASIAMFGGTFPLVAEALTTSGHGSEVPYYVAAAAAVALIGTFVAVHVPGFADAVRPRARVVER